MLIWRPGVSKAVRIPAKVEPGWRRVIYIILGRERAENASPADEKKRLDSSRRFFVESVLRRCWLFEGAEKESKTE